MEIKLTLFLATVLIASGCAAQNNPDTDPGTSTLGERGDFQLYISDQPASIDNFQYLNVTLSEVRIYPENSESANDTNSTNGLDAEEGFETFEALATVDLTQLKGDNATSVLEGELEAGNYSKIELEASNIKAEIDNSSVKVKLPSGKLQLTKSFTIAPNQTTEFIFDIQVVQRGTQGYILRPVISQSGTVGEEVEINRKEMASQDLRGPPGGNGERPQNNGRNTPP